MRGGFWTRVPTIWTRAPTDRAPRRPRGFYDSRARYGTRGEQERRAGAGKVLGIATYRARIAGSSLLSDVIARTVTESGSDVVFRGNEVAMHELSITQSLVDAVAAKVEDAQVRELTMEIGKLSGVIPDAVRFCFDIVSAGTSLEGAILTILEPPGAGTCRACGIGFTLDDEFPLCPCGSADVAITAGRELRIKYLEVR